MQILAGTNSSAIVANYLVVAGGGAAEAAAIEPQGARGRAAFVAQLRQQVVAEV